MPTLCPVGSAVKAADVSAQALPFSLSTKARFVFDVLHAVGAQVSDHRGYVGRVSEVHFFAPGESVAHACGMARSTLYRKLGELHAVGLVEARAHYVSHRGRTRADGMIWAIRLRDFGGQPARVPLDYLKASYRCLSADIKSGRTAWAECRSDSHKTPSIAVAVKRLLAWAIPPSPTQYPDTGLTVRSDLEAVLDVPHVDKAERRVAVDTAARALSAGLGDQGGLMFYRWLIWQLLRLADQGRGDHFYTAYLAACRARADAKEGFARKPGALFVSRLKAAPWWSEVVAAPPTRVGTRPN